MDTTPTQPTSGYSDTNPSYPTAGGTDTQFSTTAAHATGSGKYPTSTTTPNSQPTASGVQGTINNVLASGKKWLNDSGISDKAQQLPQAAKDLGNKAVSSVSGLTTTQKAVGVGLLAAAVAFIATRGSKGKKKHKKHKHDDGKHEFKARRSPFDHQPHTKEGNAAYDRRGQRPWGASRYGAGPAPTNRERVSSGSGYSSAPTHSPDFGSSRTSSDRSTSVGSSSFGGGTRRDQGPASGSHYDASASGSQNPNNSDQLNSAF